MDKASYEFNKQLELDVLVNGLTEVTQAYVDKHIDRKILQEVVIPDRVTRIDQWAFAACWKLKKVIISDSVTSIGKDAFYGCRNLRDLRIGNGVTSIGEEAFQWCEHLTTLKIPESVTSIGDWAFYRCWRLLVVTIPGSVKNIGHYAFCDCDDLKSMIFNDTTWDEVKAMKYYPWGVLDPEKYFNVYKFS